MGRCGVVRVGEAGEAGGGVRVGAGLGTCEAHEGRQVPVLGLRVVRRAARQAPAQALLRRTHVAQVPRKKAHLHARQRQAAGRRQAEGRPQAWSYMEL